MNAREYNEVDAEIPTPLPEKEKKVIIIGNS